MFFIRKGRHWVSPVNIIYNLTISWILEQFPPSPFGNNIDPVTENYKERLAYTNSFFSQVAKALLPFRRAGVGGRGGGYLIDMILTFDLVVLRWFLKSVWNFFTLKLYQHDSDWKIRVFWHDSRFASFFAGFRTFLWVVDNKCFNWNLLVMHFNAFLCILWVWF